MKPLDDLGAALRDVVERSRHDIDWSQHPLMKAYQEAAMGHLNQNLGRVDTRSWRWRRASRDRK